MVEEILVAILTALALCFIYAQTRRPPRFPPGPARLPIIGSITYILRRGKDGGPKTFLHGVLENEKKYGSIFGFWIGKEPMVIITDYELIKQMLRSDAATARPFFSPMNELWPKHQALKGTENEFSMPGVLYCSGKQWQEQRKFILGHLKDFGYGKQGMEDLILGEVEKLIQHLDKSLGQPVVLKEMFNISIINTLMSILMGKFFKLDDPMVIKANDAWHQLLKAETVVMLPIANFLPHPKMALLPGIMKFGGLDRVKDSLDASYELLAPMMKEHVETFDPNNMRDFFDVTLDEIYKTTNPESSFYKDVGHCFATNNLIDLFLSGTETTSSSLQWAFLILLHHPSMKQKIQQELDQVCGSKEFPCIVDKPNLPYTMAFLNESLRLNPILPFSLPHRATKDMTMGNYVIPKGTTILPSLISVFRNPVYFNEPDVFNPDRFLTPDGKLKNYEQFIPFGMGKRDCLGRVLGEHQHFLFFAALVKNFNFQLAPSSSLPSYNLRDHETDGTVKKPKEFDVVFTRR